MLKKIYNFLFSKKEEKVDIDPIARIRNMTKEDISNLFDYEVDAPEPWTIDQAEFTYKLILSKGIKISFIEPDPDGGILIHFKNGNRHAEFGFINNLGVYRYIYDYDTRFSDFDTIKFEEVESYLDIIIKDFLGL